MKLPTKVIVSVDGPAAAVPRFETTIVDGPNAVTTRSGSGSNTVQRCVACGPTLPAESVARTANVCSPTPSDE